LFLPQGIVRVNGVGDAGSTMSGNAVQDPAHRGPRRRKPDTGHGSGVVSALEAAAILGVHERTIRRAIRRGELVAVKHGRSFQITQEALDQYRQRRVSPGPLPRGIRPPLTLLAPPAEHAALPLAHRLRLSPLPTPPTRFIGRERETALVAGLLLRDEIRLVTLTGPGGVGKTRLALQVAPQIAHMFEDGVGFVSLAPVRDHGLVLLAVAEALGLREHEGLPVRDRLVSALHDREMLLVLDNVEQVLGAGPALADLLAHCPRLTMLVTSRSPLRLSAERLFAVPALALPRHDEPESSVGADDFVAMAETEAVRLFVERAQAVSADFALTVENCAAVVEICERSEGLPLAIELAAARTRLLPPAELLPRFAPLLPVLVDGPRDQPLRLRTMANAIAWSYNLLTPDEQTLFRALATFASGLPQDAAASVAASLALSLTQMSEALLSLVDQSLVRTTTDRTGQTRYSMLEPVREFGLERLIEHGEEDIVRSAYTDWCTDFAGRAEQKLNGPEQTTWFVRLEAEHANMRATLGWLLPREDAERGLRLARALAWFWTSRGYFREARGWFDAFLHADVEITPRLRAHALLEMSNVVRWQGDHEPAASLAEASLELFRELDDPLRAGAALRMLATIALDQKAVNRAASFLAQSDALLAIHGIPWDGAFSLYLAGRLAVISGDDVRAAEHFTASAEAFRGVGDRAYVAAALGRLAATRVRLGDPAAARATYAESLRIAVELDDQSWIAWGLAGAARIALGERKAVIAVRLFAAASAIREAMGESQESDEDLVPALRSSLSARRLADIWQQGLAMPRARVIRAVFAVLGVSEDGDLQSCPAPLDAEALTPREREVLRLLVDGLADKEIAATLGISRHTVSNHVMAIRDKLAAPSRAGAVAIALRDGLA
jgi:non-specific serine/threonine protein kinase